MSDDITTIFVVGFPDDMKEREFQNMFTFSPGFEAATLKVPTAEDLDDGKDAQKKQIIGFAKFRTRKEALKARDTLTGRVVDAEMNSVLKAEMAKKNLHTKRGLSSLGLSTAMAATFAGLDTPSATAMSPFPLAPKTSVPPQMLQQQQQQQSNVVGVSRACSLTNSLLAPSAMQHRPEHLRISGARGFNPFNDIPLASAPILGTSAHHRGFGGATSAFSSSQHHVNNDPSVGGLHGSVSMAQVPVSCSTASAVNSFMYSDQLSSNLAVAAAAAAAASAASASGMLLNRRGSVHGSTPVSSAISGTAYQQNHQYSHYQQQYQQSHQYPQPPLTISEPNSSDGDGLQMSSQPQQQQQHQPQQQQPKGLVGQRPAVLDIAALQPRLSQLNLGQMSATTGTGAALMTPLGNNGGAPYSASVAGTPVGMVLPMATTRSVNSNDQNPPCNTLYVGNLAIGAKEDELKAVFQVSLGFKRMSYKAKPNSGPMCFVEFESIDFATLAMKELDGRMLSNSVGGGIRLSYSKNPLGVRSQQNGGQSGAPPSALPLSAGIVANGMAYQQHMNGPSTGSIQQQSPFGFSAMSVPHTANTSSVLQQQSLPSSSSAATSPLPSPSTAVHGGSANDELNTAVPKDALSFLHQPIHQLHKQVTTSTNSDAAAIIANSTGASTPPMTQ
ncbi:hypothetical protein GGI04_002869 [Coemansia thaxteri]|nr:hypothetical protein GGI04_002869 [Coemansia thaxteri]KAJ2470673.1 hypothetical protein GGI02_002775 [Coemansia sp. RSA 2322]